MNQTDLAKDLAYVRDLAEAGQSAPLLGGRFLAMWGVLVTVAYSGHYAIASGVSGLPSVAYAWLWGGFIVLGVFGTFVARRGIGRKPGTSSIGNRTEATVWMAGGFALFAFFGATTLKSLADGEASDGFVRSLPIVFAVYGTGLITSGLAGKSRILVWAGYGSLLMIALAVWFEGTMTTWLVAALAAFLTLFVPGVIMMRNEPRNVV